MTEPKKPRKKAPAKKKAAPKHNLKKYPYEEALKEWREQNKGRPTTYTIEIADMICDRIAKGESLARITTPKNMPQPSTVYKWLSEIPEFSDKYDKAKQECAELYAEQILEIADEGVNDFNEKLDPDGNIIGWQVNKEHVQRSRLRVDARKWVAAKLKPKKFGERVQQDHTSSDGSMTPVVVTQQINFDEIRKKRKKD